MKIIISICCFVIFVPKFSFAQSDFITTIYFKPGSFVIEKKYESKLNEMLLRCKPDSIFKIKVFGFADTEGSETYNDSLSEKRVMTVYNYIQSKKNLDNKSI